MKEKILKISIAIAFLISSFVFVSIRLTSPVMFNVLLLEPAIPEHEDFTTYGEHYYVAGMIEHFREGMPQATEKFRLSKNNHPPEEAEILIFGDSHFDFSRQTVFAERISDSLNINVFLHRFAKPHNGNVLAYLNDVGYKSDKRKILIYESSERYVIDRSISEYKDRGIVSNQNPVYEALRTIRFKIFNPLSSNLYNTFLKKSYFTYYIYTKISTLKFDMFGYINEQIKEYKIDYQNGSWLFFYESVNFFKRDDINQELVSHCAHNVKSMQEVLLDQYNLELVYIIIPEKYSIYSQNHNHKKYHNFIPMIQEEFEAQGIPYLDLYSNFVEAENELYYKTDTHWNKKGVDIAVRKMLSHMQPPMKNQDELDN